MIHILIAEDESQAAEQIQASLAAESYSVVVARSGHEGIEHLKGTRFDLVITDLMMEQGTGLEVLEWVRANASSLPVIVCSSYARPEALRPHLDGLQSRVVKKPFDADELTVAVRDLLSGTRSSPLTSE